MTAILKTEFTEKNYEELLTRDRNEQKKCKQKIKNYRKISKRNQENFFDDAL